MKKFLPIGIFLAVVIFAICYSFKQRFYPSLNPRKTFERLVVNPVPNSITNIEESYFLGLDSAFWVLHFQISRTDLENILTAQHFNPINENEQFKEYPRKEDYLFLWKTRIHELTKLDVNFTNSCAVFFLKEGNGTKYFFFDTNSTETVFIADAH